MSIFKSKKAEVKSSSITKLSNEQLATVNGGISDPIGTTFGHISDPIGTTATISDPIGTTTPRGK